MRPTILEPADVSGDALAELKAWLGISRPNEDDLLAGLLHTSLAMCEAFTAQAPLSQVVEERLPVRTGRHELTSRPVEAVIAVEVIAQDGTRSTVSSDSYGLEIQAHGQAWFELQSVAEGQAVAVQIRTGTASTWNGVPAALKQGIIRLAAYHYRDRDRTAGSKPNVQPPTSVIALWRPWRSMRLQ